jgi:L,D-peptidoglycan transpeptidase YkuD (ErfK/YbiS/YcfS/YnhG family)
MMIDDENTAIIRVLNRLPSQQALVVIGRSGFKADLNLYEHHGTEWGFLRRMPANIGGNGMGKTREGDQKSPVGIFSLGIAFGVASQPQDVKYPYVSLTPQDYWVSDSKSKDYNRWVHYREGEPKDWQSAEQLSQESVCYRHAVVINYNCSREPEKGSAIFLHVWRGENMPTQGCTAVSEADMIRILQWLDPQYAPVFIQGTLEDIIGLADRT